MSIHATSELKLLFKKMQHTQASQEVASDNMARSGIGGEKTKKIEKFEKALKRKEPTGNSIKATHNGHLLGSIKQTKFKISKEKTDSPESLSGNQVSHEEALLQLNEATVDFHRLRQLNQNAMSRARTIATIGSGK